MNPNRRPNRIAEEGGKCPPTRRSLSLLPTPWPLRRLQFRSGKKILCIRCYASRPGEYQRHSRHSRHQGDPMPTPPTPSPVWFITGCSTGLCRALSEAVLKHGHRAIVTARNPSQVQDIITRFPNASLALQLDVADYGQIEPSVAVSP